MIIVILSTIKFKIKPIKKFSTPKKNINIKPIKFSIPEKILGYFIYFTAIALFIFLLLVFGPWVLYFIEIHD